MDRNQKEIELKNLNNRLASAKALIFTGYRGLKVDEMVQLRSKLRKEDAQMKVVKNRLAKRALDEQGLMDLTSFIEGPTAITSTDTDPVAPAKVLVELAKEYEALEIRGGSLDGKLMSSAEIIMLSKLPSRDELLAKMLGSLQAPAQNLVGVLSAIPRQLVNVVDAVRKTKES